MNGTASTRPGRCGEWAKSCKTLEVDPFLFNPPRRFPPELLDLSSLVSTNFLFLTISFIILWIFAEFLMFFTISSTSVSAIWLLFFSVGNYQFYWSFQIINL